MSKVPGAPGEPRAYGFSRKDSERIARVVKRVERAYYNSPPKVRQFPAGGGGGGLFPVQVGAGGIAAGSMASPTSGSATLLVPSGNGFTATGGTSITLYNPYAQAVGASKFGWAKIFNGNWYIVLWDC